MVFGNKVMNVQWVAHSLLVLEDIYMVKLENDNFLSLKPKFSRRYITDQTYAKKKLTAIYTKLIFQRLLLKLAAKCKFTF